MVVGVERDGRRIEAVAERGLLENCRKQGLPRCHPGFLRYIFEGCPIPCGADKLVFRHERRGLRRVYKDERKNSRPKNEKRDFSKKGTAVRIQEEKQKKGGPESKNRGPGKGEERNQREKRESRKPGVFFPA